MNTILPEFLTGETLLFALAHSKTPNDTKAYTQFSRKLVDRGLVRVSHDTFRQRKRQALVAIAKAKGSDLGPVQRAFKRICRHQIMSGTNSPTEE